MTDDTPTDTDTEYVAENSATNHPPSDVSDDDWQCKTCGASLADAHALAYHDCPPDADAEADQ